jgi:hypothetical protein
VLGNVEIEIDFLILCFRRALADVNRAIADLERIARERQAGPAAPVKRPPAGEQGSRNSGGKGWNHHRLRAS